MCHKESDGLKTEIKAYLLLNSFDGNSLILAVCPCLEQAVEDSAKLGSLCSDAF